MQKRVKNDFFGHFLDYGTSDRLDIAYLLFFLLFLFFFFFFFISFFFFLILVSCFVWLCVWVCGCARVFVCLQTARHKTHTPRHDVPSIVGFGAQRLPPPKRKATAPKRLQLRFRIMANNRFSINRTDNSMGVRMGMGIGMGIGNIKPSAE